MNKYFYVSLESTVIFDKRLTDKAKILYAIICFYSNNNNRFCYLKYKDLANILNIKSRQIFYLMNELVKNKYVKLVKTKTRTYFSPVMNMLQQIKDKEPAKVDEFIDENFNYNWLDD